MWSVRSRRSTIAGAGSAAELIDSQIELAGHYAYSGPAAIASLTRANGQFRQVEQTQAGQAEPSQVGQSQVGQSQSGPSEVGQAEQTQSLVRPRGRLVAREAERQPGDDYVGPSPEHVGEDDVALVLQDAVAPFARFDLGDEDQHLVALRGSSASRGTRVWAS